MKRLLCALALLTLASEANADPFSFLPAGDLAAGSGQGRADDMVYAPGILFPIDALAFANSQVYGHGGSEGPGGSQCDAENYSYPWRDNYCETRSWDMPLCPAGTGHQGQDMRPETCENLTHWVLAVTDGTITNIGSYSIYLTAPDGTRFDYLHSGNIQVEVGQEVKRGDKLSQVSNQFGGTATTIHLHFNIRQNVDGIGSVYVPPYTSLIAAYQSSFDAPPEGELEDVSCDAIRGWAFDSDEPETALDVMLRFETPLGAVEAPLVAGDARPDLCDELGSCDHGFAPLSPLSLFDGKPHPVHALLGDVELGASPMPLQCDPIVPEGERRAVSEGALAGWAFDPFWDEAPVDGAVLAALPEGTALAEAPELVVDDAGALWVVDAGRRRAVSDGALAAWRLDATTAAVADAAFAALEIGPPLGDRPVLAGGPGALFLLDAVEPAPGEETPDPEVEGDAVEPGESGCACRTRGTADDAGWAPLALLCALAIRRRR